MHRVDVNCNVKIERETRQSDVSHKVLKSLKNCKKKVGK